MIPSEEEAIALLKKHSTSEQLFEKILSHVTAVKTVALRIAETCTDVDLEIVRIGSLLHDIGRFSAPFKEKIKHGIIGADILRAEGCGEVLAKICEHHIGAGITKEEIEKQKLPLPPHDFIPTTNEEKIIAHADNLIFGTREGTFEEVLERVKRELGEDHVERFVKLKNDVEALQHG